MKERDLSKRTKSFALNIMALVEEVPRSYAGRAISSQIIRSATSVGANYRSACKARSDADFISKIGIVEEEADETLWWLELLQEGLLLPADRVEALLQEARELTAIFTAAGRTAKTKAALRKRANTSNPK